MRFQVLTAASMKFRIVFWDILPCKKLSTDVSEVRAASIIPDDESSTYLILRGSTSQKTILNNMAEWVFQQYYLLFVTDLDFLVGLMA